MPKDDLNVNVFQNKNWCSSKSDRWFFFLTLTVRGPFHSNDFKWKEIWGYGVSFWKKWKLCMLNLTKERKQPPVVILQQVIFYDISILCLWLRIIRNPIKVFSSWIFLNHVLQSSYIEEKFIVAAPVLYGCGYWFLLWKGSQNVRTAIVSYLFKDCITGFS